MKKNTEARRLKLLQLEGTGVSKPKIIHTLMTEFNVTRQTVYDDFQSKPQWQNDLLDMENAVIKIVNRHEQLFAKASILYHGTKEHPASVKQKISALYLMKAINVDLFHILCPQGAPIITINATKNEQTNIEVMNFGELDQQAFGAAVKNFMDAEARALLPTGSTSV